MEGRNKILCVGLVCIDTVLEVKSFPKEDSDQRCLGSHCQRGGNASNNCTVLGILGANPSFFGTIADTVDRSFIEEDFKKFGVDTKLAVTVEDCESPRSTVITSVETGSRTILHCNKNLRELNSTDLLDLPVDEYLWVHFEGRNVEETKKMIAYLRVINERRPEGSKITISVDVEKARSKLDDLIPLGDFVFVSKEYAQFRGWASIEETLDNLAQVKLKKGTVICAWGERGAGAVCGPGNKVHLSKSYPPQKIVDTLGAGDTFLASTIFALTSRRSIEDSIRFGCKVAGLKIGIKGWCEFNERIRHSDIWSLVQEL